MALESGYIQAPFQGISQAASSIRLPEQASVLTNVMVEVPEGLRKRPPLEYQGRLTAGPVSSDPAICLVRDPDDGSLRYFVIHSSGGITAALYNSTTLAALPLTVTAAAQTYLNSAVSPVADLILREAVDYTMVCNRKVTVTKDPTPNGTRPHEALIWIKASAYSRTYKLTVTKSGGTPRIASVLTANGNSAASAQYVDTDTIANFLLNGSAIVTDSLACTAPGVFSGNLTTDGFTYLQVGAVIQITHASVDFTVTITDGQGGVAAVALKDTTPLFTDLPSKGAPNGWLIKIADKSKSTTGAYYVNWIDGTGWKECLGPGASKGLLPSTMPIGLFKDPVLGWYLDVLPWKQRLVGDATLALDPGFVGNELMDIGFWNGRLRLVSEEECFACASDDPFRCYPSTLTTTIDSDPKSSVAPGKSRAKFRYAIVFDKALVVFGDLCQAASSAATDGSESKLEELARYDLTGVALPPRGVGTKVYFGSARSPTFLGVYEMGIDRISGREAAEDLTPAVTKLVPYATDWSAGVELHSCILYGTHGSDTLTLHMFRYVDQQRLQNAWYQWVLPSGYVLAGLLSQTTIFHALLRQTSNNSLHLATVDISPQRLDASGTVFTHWDMRLPDTSVVSKVYDPVAKTTTVTVGATQPAITILTQVSARAPGTTFPEGYKAGVVSRPSGTQIVLFGDWSTQAFYIGYGYTYTWQLSTLFMRGADQRPLGSNKLTLRSIEFDLDSSSQLQVTTVNGTRAPRTYQLGNTTLGSPAIFTGRFRVPVEAENTKLTVTVSSDAHLPGRVLGLEWFGEFNAKARRQT